MNNQKENSDSSLNWMFYWSLPQYTPRSSQTKIINRILWAIDNGYKNIILEAGTGIGKSAIATTLANMFEDSFILTMTKQLQMQYMADFPSLVEIKGKGNYKCNFKGNCDFCIKNEYKIPRCPDCQYGLAYKKAKNSQNVITNYDFFYLSIVTNKTFDPRKLLILDEAHNLEHKMLQMSTAQLSREYISTKFGIDIFKPIMDGSISLNKLKRDKEYWIDLCKELSKQCKEEIHKIKKDVNEITGEDNQISLDAFERNPSKFSAFDFALKQELEAEKKVYDSIYNGLMQNELIIDLPDKNSIKSNKMKLTADFKPYSVSDETKKMLAFGDICIFLTGTLGDKNKFCKWNNINVDDTYYIYEKSPFAMENRPIKMEFVTRMSGKRRGVPNWKNERALSKIRELVDRHKGEKGVIHTSSNAQAYWIIENLSDYNLVFVGGDERDNAIKDFSENSSDDTILIGASIKDGVDFKGDLCRFQIIFKVPYMGLNEQVKFRMDQDKSWYYYQAVMALMQAYGRGIRDQDDYCVMYILDRGFINLFNYNRRFFNEYFSEAAIEGFKQRKKIRHK